MKNKATNLIVVSFISIIFSIFLAMAVNTEFNFSNLYSALNFKGKNVENLVPESDMVLVENAYFSKANDIDVNFKGIKDQYISSIKMTVQKEASEPVIEFTLSYLDGTSQEYKTIRQADRGRYIEFYLNVNSRVTDLKLHIMSQSEDGFYLTKSVIDNSIMPNTITKTFLTQVFLFSIFIIFILMHFIFNIKNMYNLIYKYRWYIGAGIIAICVLLELSGSSISMWNQYFPSDERNVVLGYPRPIRTDEWSINTPMAISQQYTGYSYFGDIIRGTTTDSFIVYGQPTWHIAEIFRPFHWGYLLFGASKGLAFFWCARLVLLFLISFEFIMWITKNHKLYSLLGALMICFAPIVQWWFAINGLVEMIIAFELSVLCLLKYIETQDFRKRALYFSMILICAGMFILTFYPAWMIPIAYIILIFIIYVIYEKRKVLKFSKFDVLSIVILSGIFIAIMASVFINSKETINAVLNTDYPGSRFETGGHFIKRSMNYFMSLLLPYLPSKDLPVGLNVVEMSSFVSLFPIGLILAIVHFIRDKKKDILVFVLFLLSLFFTIYMFFGFDPLIAKITMMYQVPVNRASVGFGIVNILILLRCLALHPLKFPAVQSIVISAGLSLFLAKITMLTAPQYINFNLYLFLIIFGFITFMLIFYKKCKPAFFSIPLCIVLFVTGSSVNPIQQSLDVIEKSDFSLSVKKIQDNDPGVWMFEDATHPILNYIIMSGIPSVNSTHTYPNLKLWHKLDSEKQYQNIYNRYANIEMVMVNNDEQPEKFVLNHIDSFKVYINTEDLKVLNVKYILSNKNLSAFSNDNIKINKISSINRYDVYKVNYTGG